MNKTLFSAFVFLFAQAASAVTFGSCYELRWINSSNPYDPDKAMFTCLDMTKDATRLSVFWGLKHLDNPSEIIVSDCQYNVKLVNTDSGQDLVDAGTDQPELRFTNIQTDANQTEFGDVQVKGMGYMTYSLVSEEKAFSLVQILEESVKYGQTKCD